MGTSLRPILFTLLVAHAGLPLFPHDHEVRGFTPYEPSMSFQRFNAHCWFQDWAARLVGNWKIRITRTQPELNLPYRFPFLTLSFARLSTISRLVGGFNCFVRLLGRKSSHSTLQSTLLCSFKDCLLGDFISHRFAVWQEFQVHQLG